MHATANPKGQAASVRVHHRVGSDGDPQPSAAQDIGAGGQPADVTVALSGLTPSTTYHYAAVVETVTHQKYGETGMFTTPAGGGAPDQRAPPVQPPAAPQPAPKPGPAAARAQLARGVTVTRNGQLKVKVACAPARAACRGRITVEEGKGRRAKTVARANLS